MPAVPSATLKGTRGKLVMQSSRWQRNRRESIVIEKNADTK